MKKLLINISDKFARKLKSVMGKPSGWLDQNVSRSEQVEIPVISTSLKDSSLSECLATPLSYIGIDKVTISNFGWNPNNLLIVAMNDNSMKPVFKKGIEIIIDRSINTIINNKFYAVRVNSNITIRKLFKAPTSNIVNLIPENKKEFPKSEYNLENSDFEMVGKVIYLKVAL